MSISSVQKTRLGIFIVAALVVTFVVFAAGVGLKLSEKRVTYYSEFRGESLSGLTEGMKVKYYGIEIGEVADIAYDPKDLEVVTVELSVKEEFPMKVDMIIQTGMQGITGMKYIEIMGGDSVNESPLLEPGSMIESKPSLMASIMDKADEILLKVDILIGNLNTITNPDSLSEISTILANVSSLTGNLDTLVENAAPRMEAITRDLSSTLGKVDAMVGDFQENSDLTKIMNDVDSTIVSILSLTENFNLTFVQSREDLSATMLDLRETMENLNNLSQVLLENPSLILRGSPQQKRKIK